MLATPREAQARRYRELINQKVCRASMHASKSCNRLVVPRQSHPMQQTSSSLSDPPTYDIFLGFLVLRIILGIVWLQFTTGITIYILLLPMPTIHWSWLAWTNSGPSRSISGPQKHGSLWSHSAGTLLDPLTDLASHEKACLAWGPPVCLSAMYACT